MPLNIFRTSSSTQSLLPLASTAAALDTTPTSDENQSPFATPLPSQAPSPLVSLASTPCGSTADLISLVKKAKRPTQIVEERSEATADHLKDSAPTDCPPPVITISEPTSIRSTASDSQLSQDLAPNEKLRDQLSNALEPQQDLPRPPLPPSLPSLTPSQKWTRGPGFWRSFAAICIPLLLSALEGSITNTALPTISSALDLGTMFSWVATAFLLASTILQPLYGQLADLWGRKYPMMLSILVFGIGSAICGWANSGAVLIFGRIIQGLGTGGIDLFAELILSDLVPLRQRGTYMALKHVVFATGTTVGPLLGGVFAETGWRWCFWINIPVCILSLILMIFWLRVGGGAKVRDISVVRELRKIDALGTSLLTSAVVLILVSLSTGGASHPWTNAGVFLPFSFGVIGIMLFPFWERSERCRHPVMPPHIFSNRTSATAFALTAIHGFLTYGVQFYLPPFFQAVKGSSPSKSGIQVLPMTLVIVGMAALGGPLLSRYGKYKPIHQIGFACMTLGLGLCTMLASNTPVGAWFMFEIIFAFGSGIMVSTMLPAVQVELPDKANGAAAGSWAFLRGAGSLFGVAIPGALFNLRFNQLLSSVSSSDAQTHLADGQAYQHAASPFAELFGDKVKEEIAWVFMESLKCVWIIFAVFAGVGFALTFLERQVKMRRELDTQYGLKTPKGSGASTPRGRAGASVGKEMDLEKDSGCEEDVREV